MTPAAASHRSGEPSPLIFHLMAALTGYSPEGFWCTVDAADVSAQREGEGGLTRRAEAVRADVKLVSSLSFLLVAAFLFWRYRSPVMLAVVAVPLALGTSLYLKTPEAPR